MEKQGIEYNLTENIDAKSKLSDSYVKLNKAEFQQKVLSLDHAAVQKALTSEIQLRTNGLSELQKISKLYGDDNSQIQTFTIEYPDGSRVSAKTENVIETDKSKIVSVFSPEEIDRINNSTGGVTKDERVTLLAQSPFINGPWSSTSLISTDPHYLYNRDYPSGWPSGQLIQVTSKTEWSFTSGVSYSKLNDVFQWQWYGVVRGSGESAVYDFSVAPVSDSGGGSSYGVVFIKTENPNHPRKSGTGTTARVQGYMDVLYEVSASFSAAWDILGVNVSAGGQWHQYAITEVDGWTYIDKYAGTLK